MSIKNLGDALTGLFNNPNSPEAKEYFTKYPLTYAQLSVIVQNEFDRRCVVLGLVLAIASKKNALELLDSLSGCFSSPVLDQIKSHM